MCVVSTAAVSLLDLRSRTQTLCYSCGAFPVAGCGPWGLGPCPPPSGRAAAGRAGAPWLWQRGKRWAAGTRGHGTQAGTAPSGAVSPRSQQRQKRRVTESLAFEDMTSPERTESAAQKQSQNGAVLREGISREQKQKLEQIAAWERCRMKQRNLTKVARGRPGGRCGSGAGLILSLGGPPVVPRPAHLGSVSLPQ